MPEWVLPVLLGIAAIISVVVGTKVARRALKKRRMARRTQHHRAKLWRDAVARMEQVQALQASYEGVPMGEITAEQAWDRAFSMPKFSSVHRPEHQAMIKNLRAANTMCQSLRVPGSDTTGTITLEGTDDQLAAFHAAITEYEIAVQTNASSARALGTSELSDQLQGLISQSRAILSQIGEGSVLPEDTMTHLLEKLNRNVAQINQLHGSEMIRPAMVRAIGTELTRRRAITV